jgi:hypothetical protein
MPCWIGIIGKRLHDSIFNLNFVIVSSGMHLQPSLMMMMMSLLITTKMYIEYSAVIFSTKFKSKISVTYQQDTVTSALCRSEIPNLGRAKLSGRHHWCKNTFFLLVLAVHGMIIYAMRLPLEVI